VSIPIAGVVGPTATGKTRLAVRLAQEYNGEVVSADSMQVYRGMNIGTAKPTIEEMQGIKHHLIDCINPDEPFNVARFVELAHSAISDIYSRGKLPIIAGGTGLYVNSLIDNITFNEFRADLDLRESLNERLTTEGSDALYKELCEVDSESAAKIHPNNSKRLVRALEVYYATGVKISEWAVRSRSVSSPYKPCLIGLNYSNRALLYEKIDKRVDLMVEGGLIDEVKGLISAGLTKNDTSMQAIGYKEIAQYLFGELSKEEATLNVKRESRRYAKRQLTWFKRDERINWIEANDDFENILKKSCKNMEKSLLM
jgi:tRNA dimethylallyltransferase